MLESNMPVGVFLKYSREGVDAIYVVNDGDEPLGALVCEYVFTDGEGNVIASESVEIQMDADARVECAKLDVQPSGVVNCALILKAGGQVIAANHYEDLFRFPEHVKGHPSRMSHEIGMRLYFA